MDVAQNLKLPGWFQAVLAAFAARTFAQRAFRAFAILARAKMPVAQRGARRAGRSAPGIRGTETILLAENEDDLREIIAEYLRNHGYRVLEAKDGIEAPAVAERGEKLIHMLVTDLVMPRLGGWTLAERLVVARPEIKITYLSGYSHYSMTASADKPDGWRRSFIQKPFTMNALGEKIREVLTGSSL